MVWDECSLRLAEYNFRDPQTGEAERLFHGEERVKMQKIAYS